MSPESVSGRTSLIPCRRRFWVEPRRCTSGGAGWLEASRTTAAHREGWRVLHRRRAALGDGDTHSEVSARRVARGIAHPQRDRVDPPVLGLVALCAQLHCLATGRDHDVFDGVAVAI